MKNEEGKELIKRIHFFLLGVVVVHKLRNARGGGGYEASVTVLLKLRQT